ncbi:flagellar motor switch protein FliM [Kozakia baliensis]|uniref:flagellar motor switch protein FliM n=1 Tax=Kozakia baliensis TaxID=153496 RepID=UPI00345C0898
MTDVSSSDNAHPIVKQRIKKTGIAALIGASGVSYERLPMLEVVFDRFVRLLSAGLRKFTSDNVDVALENIVSQRFGDTFKAISPQAMYAVFRAEEWENYGVLILDASLVYLVIDALLGGDRTIEHPEDLLHFEQRPYTPIERALIEPLVRSMLTDLAQSFSPLCAVTFRFERLESNERFATICRPVNGVIAAKFQIGIAARSGQVTLILPHGTLEPVRDVLLQQFMGEKFGHDITWEQHLAQELWLTDIEMDVILDEQVLCLRDILNLEPGSRLTLKRTGNGMARIRSCNKPLFEGRIGQHRGHVAVKIEQCLDDRLSNQENRISPE